MDSDPLLKELATYPIRFCQLCFFGDPTVAGMNVNNGTITLVERQGNRFGITNYHVIDHYRQRRKNEVDLTFHIGSTSIDVDARLHDECQTLDLCVLDLNGIEIADLNQQTGIRANFLNLEMQVRSVLSSGEYVAFGGYPGCWRDCPNPQTMRTATFGSAGIPATEVTDLNIRVEVKENELRLSLADRFDKQPVSPGGMSGAPVFKLHLRDSDFLVLVLVGIIYEYMPLYESILIRPMSYFDVNMNIIN